MNWWRRGDPLTEAPPRKGRPQPANAIPVADRFWSKVDFSTPDDCWRWTGGYRHEYGQFHLEGRNAYAHRVAAMLVHGDLPDDAVVLHRCDNPACVRPDHLAVGTQADNIGDMADKGRWRNQHAIGPGHPDRITS